MIKPNIEDIIQKGINLHHYTNTAYPLNGSKVFRQLKEKVDKDNAVREGWNKVKELGLYTHIPFCEKRCLYCEYVVVKGEESDKKNAYVNALVKEIGMFRSLNQGKRVTGLDIGGGTPTALSSKQIEIIMNETLKGYSLMDDFEVSIETTPKIAERNYEKIADLKKMGINRISMGVQTIDPHILERIGRESNPMSSAKKATEHIRKAGFNRFNLDLMYGFAGQSKDSWEATLDFALQLNPEFITLYRNRFKGTRLECEAGRVSLDEANELYSRAFEKLNNAGFSANMGKNTFSRVKGNPGTSAYLTKRVIEGTPYLGMGLGAQSFGLDFLSYNTGAANKQMKRYLKDVDYGHFPIQDFYHLPLDESVAKMICVSFYFGGINKPAFEKRFGQKVENMFTEEIKYLLNKNWMYNTNEELLLTEQGKDMMTGIIPLFYSNRSKENLMTYKPKIKRNSLPIISQS